MNNAIESGRLRLRRLKISDLENMQLLEGDGDIMKHTPSVFEQTPEQSKKKLADMISKQTAQEPLGTWGVELKESRDFVAWCMLIKADLEFTELGYMLVQKFWNRGFATEIVEALARFAKSEAGLKGLSARTTFENASSIRILEKAGFKFTHVVKVADQVRGGQVELRVFKLQF